MNSRDNMIRVSKASHLGLAELKQALAATGVDINATSPLGSFLHEVDNPQAAKCLVEAGALIESLNSQGSTPLMSACNKGKVKGSQVAMMLIKLGADVRDFPANTIPGPGTW